MSSRAIDLAIKLVLCTALVACSTEVATLPAPPEPAVHEDPPADALEATLREYGADRAPYMDRLGPAMRGEVAPRASRDLSALLRSGWCYKVVGVGGAGLEDIDVRLYDPNSVLIERDVQEDQRAAIGVERPVCPVESGTYRIEVRAARGQGPFAVQVYRSI